MMDGEGHPQPPCGGGGFPCSPAPMRHSSASSSTNLAAAAAAAEFLHYLPFFEDYMEVRPTGGTIVEEGGGQGSVADVVVITIQTTMLASSTCIEGMFNCHYRDTIFISHTMSGFVDPKSLIGAALPLALHLFDGFDQLYQRQHKQQQQQQQISWMPSPPPKLLQHPLSYQGHCQFVSHTTLWGGRLHLDNWAAADSLGTLKIGCGHDKAIVKCHKITPFIVGLFHGHSRISDFCLGILRDKAISLGGSCTQARLAESVKSDAHLMVIMQKLKEQDSEEYCGILLVSSITTDQPVCYIVVEPKEPHVSYSFSSREGAGHGYSYARHLSNLPSDLPRNEALEAIRDAFVRAAKMDEGTGGHVLIYYAEMDKPWKFCRGYELPEM